MNDIELKLQKSSNSAIINVYSKTINQFAVFSSCDVDSFVKLKQDVHSLGFEFKEFVGILNNNEIFLLLIQGISNKKANQIAQKYNISLFFFNEEYESDPIEIDDGFELFEKVFINSRLGFTEKKIYWGILWKKEFYLHHLLIQLNY